VTFRSGVFEYLPKFENETDGDYQRRRNAPLTNIYSDISRNLASKPFSKTLELDEAAPDQYKKLAENIDGQGNNLHVFAAETFKSGLDKGIDWILVDYTKVPPGSTLADEAGIGARPYWVRIQAERMLAVYSDFLNGRRFSSTPAFMSRRFSVSISSSSWSSASACSTANRSMARFRTSTKG
jgi:hypothetical protein